ncbi:amidohydrolase [Pseudomonas sp. MF6784]|uniref:M20 aminoacylase family protein n=1 Tax=Pseudomonas TaxID=286 RepID=UPI00164654A6|nr:MULTISPECIES: M20 aminoacylase family protein [Pseudomonas]MBJ2252134.1 amidohydrolase [Pseudomonas sp. MF6784]MBK3453515.1 amidohydrolase [Pseudomonas sp. MF6754]MBU4627395.1 amidohydrolase [Pseudomonas sp. BF61]QXH87089.1 amidohydrolase [Pseudomonas shahriarae]
MSHSPLHVRLQDSTERFVTIRRDIHAQPELGQNTQDTAALVIGLLESWGYAVHSGIGGCGVVGVLRRGNSSKSLGLRADMDALPIVERNGLPWASRREGVMHACGHDGHTATLLAAAEQLALHSEFDGTVNLIFQPDEEGLTGAKAMMDDDLFRRFPCDAVYAFHNMPGFPVGHAIIKNGGVMASSERVCITLTGRGGHGAMPERSIDPVPALAGVISALQTVVSRNIGVNDSAVISIGKVQAGTAVNIIPETAMLELSVRTLDPQVRAFVEQRIREIVQGQAASFGVTAHIDYQLLAPVLVNTPVETQHMLEAAKRALGPANVMEQVSLKAMGSEDFAWMLHEVPGCYFGLGNGLGEFNGCSVHNDHYDFNDELIPLGAACWVALVEGYLR